MAKVYDTATDLITFARSSSGTALRRVGYGPELVVDGSGNWVGDFDVAADVSEWTTVGGGTVEIFEGTLKINRVSGGVAAIYELTDLTVGKVYSFDFDLVAGVPRVDISTTGVAVPGAPVYSAGKNSFVATSETLYLRFSLNSGDGTSGQFDNISVKEVIFDRATDDLVLFNHPDDIPRIEYAADGSLKGLLIEEQRTNLVTYSEDFENAAWDATRCDLTNDQAISPDGTQNAALMTATDDDARLEMTNLGDDTKAHACSVWVKSATGSSVAGQIDNAGLGAVSFTATSEWQRVTAVYTTSGFGMRFRLRITNSGDSLYIYGAQLEEGSFATSYIPTSGGQKTRDPDIASIPVSAFGYNQTAGTVVVEQSTFNDVKNAVVWQVDDGTATNRHVFNAFNGNTTVVNGAAAQVSLTHTGQNPNTTYKHGFGYKLNSFASVYDGGGPVTDVLGTVPTVSILRFGADTSPAAYLNGHIKSIKYYPRRLTDAQLQELTS